MPAKTQIIPDFTSISYTQYQEQYPNQPISRATYQRYRAVQLKQTISAVINNTDQSVETVDTRSIVDATKKILSDNVISNEDKTTIVSRAIDCLKAAVLTQPLTAQWALERLLPEQFAKRELSAPPVNNLGIKIVFGGKRRSKDITDAANVSINR